MSLAAGFLLGLLGCGRAAESSAGLSDPTVEPEAGASGVPTDGAGEPVAMAGTGPVALDPRGGAGGTAGSLQQPTQGVGGDQLPTGNGGTVGGSPGAGGDRNTGGTSPASGASTGNPGNGGIPSSGGTGGSQTVGGNTGAGGATPEPDVLTVQLGEVRQIIRGFGINATIVPTGRTLPWEQLFTLDGADGLGLSILRIGMHETGVHRGVPDDWETARSLGARVIGTCWSAPASWKTNQSTRGGGHLLPDFYEEWATMIADYANEHELYAMSIGSQTDFATCAPSQGVPCEPPLTDEFESMVYTAREMAVFVKVARPIFEAIAPNTKLIAPETSSWTHLWSNLSPTAEDQGFYESADPFRCNCFANEIDAATEATCAPHCLNGDGYDYGHWLARDPDSWSAVDILGVHQYESQIANAWPADVSGGVRDKEVWQTEMAGQTNWPETGPSTDIANGVAVARWIHSALTVGEASAWLYWAYEAHFRNDNQGLALIQGSSSIAKRYYTMGNFSRYIRPDVFHAVRVAGPSPENVMVSGYKGDDDQVVIVAINETHEPVDLPIAISGGTMPTMMVPHVTTYAENWTEGAPVAVLDGSLLAALPAMSVTTFAGD